jgi:ubiquinone/menaquinone biosynthesis C-methylase UbiE
VTAALKETDMAELSIYYARAMDARCPADIIADAEKYQKLLQPIGGMLINTFQEEGLDVVTESFGIAERDLAVLRTADVVLADLSLEAYQYVGCIFEIVHAVIQQVPVVLVTGQRDFANRVFLQAYCDFIAREPSEAIDYISRTRTARGIRQQLAEMKSYYDLIAPCYKSKSFAPGASDEHQVAFAKERNDLRALITEYASGSVCEVGSGTGDWTRSICAHASQVVGIEVSDRMIDQAHRHLDSFENLQLLRGDILCSEMVLDRFDCVVVYFLLSLFPPPVQAQFFERLATITKKGSVILVADTMKIANASSSGLGRRRLQRRQLDDVTFTLYKEHFDEHTLSTLFKNNGYEILDVSKDSVWFSWVVARRVA